MKFKNILTSSFRHFSTVIFFAGFAFDLIMLPDFSEVIAKVIGLGHILVVATFIIMREWVVSRNRADETEARVFSFLTFFISFSSGAALSFVFVYAIRSADILSSWPFFLILLCCMFVNEFVGTHDFRLMLDVGVLFVAILFYSIFNVPYILKTENDFVFGASVVIAIVASLIYLRILRKSSETARNESAHGHALAVGIPMFVAMFYFLNLIPAVPISLKDVGVYHYIEKTDSGDFTLKGYNDKSPLSFLKVEKYQVLPEDTGVYFYSAIDAPADIKAPISHTWEFYDTYAKKWISNTRIDFGIIGGRDEGYRAYSKKENIMPGLWRVVIKVGNNRIIGIKKFEVSF